MGKNTWAWAHPAKGVPSKTADRSRGGSCGRFLRRREPGMLFEDLLNGHNPNSEFLSGK